VGGRDVHRGGTWVLSVLLIVVGVAVIVRTLIAGGGGTSLGIILGVLFTAAGAGRLWVAWRTG
jgi:hypothetical protein